MSEAGTPFSDPEQRSKSRGWHVNGEHATSGETALARQATPQPRQSLTFSSSILSMSGAVGGADDDAISPRACAPSTSALCGPQEHKEAGRSAQHSLQRLWSAPLVSNECKNSARTNWHKSNACKGDNKVNGGNDADAANATSMLIAVLGRCRLARAAVRHVACPLLRHPKFDALTISAARSGATCES